MSLARLLEQQGRHFDDLLDLLRREQDLLVAGARDGVALKALAEAKLLCFRSLEGLDAARREAQRQLGPAAADDDAEAARHCDCFPLWQQVQDQARRAKHLNLLNGSLIQQGLRHNQRVLDALRQITGSPLYEANGQPGKSRSRLQTRA